MSTFTPGLPYWAQWVDLVVELGSAPSWLPGGPAWGLGEWGVDEWGGLLDPEWREVTFAVEDIETDTGRQGALDPGDVGRCSLTLYDPGAEFGLGGDSAIGNLVRIRATVGENDDPIFFGRIVEAIAPGDLDVPEVLLRADDILGSALGHEDYSPLPATSASGRIGQLLDRANFPDDRRDIEPDGTELIEVDRPGTYRLDAARDAAKAAGGTLWAGGEGIIRYRGRYFTLPADPTPQMRIGTTAEDDADPSALALFESREQVANDIYHATEGAALVSRQVDPLSRSRYGNRSEVITDYLNAAQYDLDDVARRRLDAAAWPVARVDPCQVPVIDEDSAAVINLTVGSLVLLTYSGADAWQRLQLVGGIGHSITAEEWVVTLRTYDALILLAPGPARWSLTRWGEATWQGEAPPSLIEDFQWAVLYWVDGPAFRSMRESTGGALILNWPDETDDPAAPLHGIGWRPGSAMPAWGLDAPAGVDLAFGQLASGQWPPTARPWSLVWCGRIPDTGDPVPFEQLVTLAALGGDDVPALFRNRDTFEARTATATVASSVPVTLREPVLVIIDFFADALQITVNGITDDGPPITDPAPLVGVTLGSSPVNVNTNPTMARTWVAGVIAGVLTRDERADLLARMARYGVVDLGGTDSA